MRATSISKLMTRTEITQDEFSVEVDYFVNCFYKRDSNSLYLVGGDNRYIHVTTKYDVMYCSINL